MHGRLQVELLQVLFFSQYPVSVINQRLVDLKANILHLFENNFVSHVIDRELLKQGGNLTFVGIVTSLK